MKRQSEEPKFKLEDRPVPLREVFWNTIREMQVGQSFLIKRCDSNLRNGLYIAAVLLERKFATRTEGDGVRVSRTK